MECEYLSGWIRNGHISKNLTQNGEPQSSSWGMKRRRRYLNFSAWMHFLSVQIEEKIKQLDQSLEGLIRNLEHRRKLHLQNLEAQVTVAEVLVLF